MNTTKYQNMPVKLLLTIFCFMLLGISCKQPQSGDNSTDPKIAKLRLPPGFHEEHLYSPKEQGQGSWVAMNVVNKGRLNTRVQYGNLYRVTVPPVAFDTTKTQTIQIEELKVDHLLYPDFSVANGYPVVGASGTGSVRTYISNKQPVFSWELGGTQAAMQSAYQVIISKTRDSLEKGTGDVWNSGKILSGESVNVLYQGKSLTTGTGYVWRVKVWDKRGQPSAWSPISEFYTADTLEDYKAAYYPLQKTDELPPRLKKSGDILRIDFGKAAFGQLRLNMVTVKAGIIITVRLGEAINQDGSINRKPGGTIRYAEYQVPLKRGQHTYQLQFLPDKRNTGPMAVKVPDYIGTVLPFRYVEIEGYPGIVKEANVVRASVHYPFDDFASYFNSSDSVLNAVWELCKYSVKAVSFAGIYVDGDRERIPYEADAHVNQLSNYSVDKEYSMARRSLVYLIQNATWFTDCVLQTVPMAYNDYLCTGDIRLVRYYYEDLKAKLLLPLREANGLMSTRTGKQSSTLMKEIHAVRRSLNDLVDWPHANRFGQPGETDGFVFTNYNTVVNALHYKALSDMVVLATALERNADVELLNEKIRETRKAFHTLLWDKNKRLFRDGIGTDHTSLHANMMALAFGLVPEGFTEDVMAFIRSRGMACGPYSTLFLMDAIYKTGNADYGLSLFTSKNERSWYNMIKTGSTITMEAWDNKYKSNLDWNHPWGTVPASAIPRKLMGIEPLEPGFRKIRIKPQPASLEWATIKYPTIRGAVLLSFKNKPRQSFSMNLTLPSNTTANVYLPLWFKSQKIIMNGNSVKYRQEGNFAVIENVRPGNSTFKVIK